MASNGKRTKGQNKAADRRVMRKREKTSNMFVEKMMGACRRRGYGKGVAR